MHLPHTLDSFTPADWERTFGAFVKANRSHWRGAPYDAVMQMLRQKRRFEFAVTGMDTWTCKFVLTVLEDGSLDVQFVPNDTLSPLMQKHLARMKESFEQELQKP